MRQHSVLRGVRIVEQGTFITGPCAAMMLADMGADVIKIESPEGDTYRAYQKGLYSPHFQAYNRNKRGMSCDLKQPADREIFEQLVAEADVYIQNFRPGTADRLGAGLERLHAINPKLVYCSISGFGADGPYSERPGLSPNTLSAYRADLTALDRWLQARGTSSVAAKKADLLAFIAHRVEAGARPRSTARQLSSFRRFYRHLIREGAIKEDPTAQIAMPKIGRTLPKSLTEEEVEALLGAPESEDPLGFCDRSMLEVLYATGLRVSELVNLRSSQVNMNQGVLRIVGKGARERLIPLGEEAVGWLQRFMNGPRLEILLERQTDYLFPTRRGDRNTSPTPRSSRQ